MPNYRRIKINDEVARTMSDILRTVKDPRVSGEFISITRAEVTGDLSRAVIYYSFFGDLSNENKKEVKKGLYSAAGYMRGELSRRLYLRETPELDFEFDEGIARGAHIAKLLDDIAKSPKSDDAGKNEADDGTDKKNGNPDDAG